MNKIVLVGRLTKDPELKFTQGKGTAAVNATIAIDRDGLKDQAGNKLVDFIPLVIWGKQAENTANYCKKGDLISVDGRIQTRSYDAKDGTKKYVTEVNVARIEFLQPKNTNKQDNSAPQQNYSAPQQYNGAPQQYNGSQQQNYGSPNQWNENDLTPVDDGDIPF